MGYYKQFALTGGLCLENWLYPEGAKVSLKDFEWGALLPPLPPAALGAICFPLIKTLLAYKKINKKKRF